ncbi:MAG: non-hydrolyzing UDP-N-acetylglucosamine 2-epimerase [Gemmatimonadota bacterium]
MSGRGGPRRHRARSPARRASGAAAAGRRPAARRRPLKLLLVAGARPNFMKIAPLLRELRARPGLFRPRLVHTGQHYDDQLSDVFFEELEIPPPEVHLGAGSASHALQTARIMERFETVLLEDRPDWVIVVGDVNSTLACSVVAAKMSPPVPVAHVEAGLRSRDRSMPEEINRMVTDALSDLLFTTSPDADRNLRAEGVDRRKIHRVGNVMIDTLRRFARRSDHSDVVRRLGVSPPFALVTLHRPSNVDDEGALRRILGALAEIAGMVPVIFPAHPRTVKMMRRFGLAPAPEGGTSGPRLVEPLGYLDFLHLQARAALLLTDSGGIQEEATILGVPCLTLRDNTERPITITRGTNRLVGSDPRRIVTEASRILASPPKRRPVIPLWDGRAAARIAAVLARRRP